jgi:hypothetical protein
MAASRENDPPHKVVDVALQEWRQGDYVLGEQWFIHRFNPELPLTNQSTDAAAQGSEFAETPALGLVVLTQSCDIVRNSLDRPFIEVAPIVEVSEQHAHEIERGLRPQYAIIPALRNAWLVVDLSRTMTIEKGVMVKWRRRTGCQTDDERRRFASALQRKRARFAFPDDFSKFAQELLSRIRNKHDKQNDEGRALRALREIRVHAAPSWESAQVELMFWFIRNEDELDFEGNRWELLVEGWLRLIPASGRFTQANGVVVTLADLTAKDYVESDQLDLDYLSTRQE